MPIPTNLSIELAVARAAALEAGAVAVRLRNEGVRYGRKDGFELVSEADLHAAEILHHRLQTAFPEDGWLSEEHTDSADRLRRHRTWVVDPIDGTREYLQGIPEYSVSIGLVVAGKAVLGIVHNPATGELFAAPSGLPTESAAPERRQRTFTVLVGRGEHYYDDLPPLPPGARTRPVGSVAYRLALVAAGRADAAVTASGRSEWDVAAGAALCAAAGIRVTDALGDDLTFNQPEPIVRGLIAARPALHARLDALFARYRP